MSASENLNTIDLTDSFCLISHGHLTDSIIEIEDTDESFTDEVPDTTVKNQKDGSRKSIKKRNENKVSFQKVCTTPGGVIGSCPICYERLGKRQMCSTICGHVFCKTCLDLAYQHDKRCPQCRKVLKGPFKYHPIYLPLTIK